MTGNSEATGARTPWRACHGRTAGNSHIQRGIPCQDAAHAWTSPRPALLALDGRGSASFSHAGAIAACDLLRKHITTLEPQLAATLDSPCPHLAEIGWRGLAYSFYEFAARTQSDVADFFGRNPADCEFTLTLAVIGASHCGWMAVGDSPLLASVGGVCGMVTEEEAARFANQTTFITTTPRPRLGIRAGIIPTRHLDGLMAMSDGTAARMVDLRAQCPAPAAATVLEAVADSANSAPDFPVQDFLQAAHWNQATGDDRCIAILARTNTRSPQKKPRKAEQPAAPPEPPEPAAQNAARNGASPATAPLNGATSRKENPSPKGRLRQNGHKRQRGGRQGRSQPPDPASGRTSNLLSARSGRFHFPRPVPLGFSLQPPRKRNNEALADMKQPTQQEVTRIRCHNLVATVLAPKLGTLWWVWDRMWKKANPKFTPRPDGQHPGLSLAFDQPKPMLPWPFVHGRSEVGPVKVAGLDKRDPDRLTFFCGTLALCHFHAGDFYANPGNEHKPIEQNMDKPRITDDEMFQLLGFLRHKLKLDI